MRELRICRCGLAVNERRRSYIDSHESDRRSLMASRAADAASCTCATANAASWRNLLACTPANAASCICALVLFTLGLAFACGFRFTRHLFTLSRFRRLRLASGVSTGAVLRRRRLRGGAFGAASVTRRRLRLRGSWYLYCTGTCALGAACKSSPSLRRFCARSASRERMSGGPRRRAANVL